MPDLPGVAGARARLCGRTGSGVAAPPVQVACSRASPPARRSLSRLSTAQCKPQLRAGGVEAAQQQPAAVLDGRICPKTGLDDRLALGVDGATVVGAQLAR